WLWSRNQISVRIGREFRSASGTAEKIFAAGMRDTMFSLRRDVHAADRIGQAFVHLETSITVTVGAPLMDSTLNFTLSPALTLSSRAGSLTPTTIVIAGICTFRISSWRN